MAIDDRRARRLYAMAEQDEIYLMWKHGYKDCEAEFNGFVSGQPEEVRNFLYGYADNGRMMMQRLVNLACKYMVFPDEE